jgi:hypothetical protein
MVELIPSSSNFPCILDRDLQPVLQHACVSSPNVAASNLFISGIPYALDSKRQFTSPAYAVFLRTHQRVSILPRSTEQIIAGILSEDITLQGCLRNRLDSVGEMTSVDMDEPHDGTNLAIFMWSRLAQRSTIGGYPRFLSLSKAFTSLCAL